MSCVVLASVFVSMAILYGLVFVLEVLFGFSVRINERKQQDNKKIAYLVDLHTVSIG